MLTHAVLPRSPGGGDCCLPFADEETEARYVSTLSPRSASRGNQGSLSLAGCVLATSGMRFFPALKICGSFNFFPVIFSFLSLLLSCPSFSDSYTSSALPRSPLRVFLSFSFSLPLILVSLWLSPCLLCLLSSARSLSVCISLSLLLDSLSLSCHVSVLPFSPLFSSSFSSSPPSSLSPFSHEFLPTMIKHFCLEKYVSGNSLLVLAWRNLTSQAPGLLCTLLRTSTDRGTKAPSCETQNPGNGPRPPRSQPVPLSLWEQSAGQAS